MVPHKVDEMLQPGILQATQLLILQRLVHSQDERLQCWCAVKVVQVHGARASVSHHSAGVLGGGKLAARNPGSCDRTQPVHCLQRRPRARTLTYMTIGRRCSLY